MPDDATNATSNRPTRQDLLASVVVFLVALPLCMGIALASGVPIAAGLITGIVGGLVVGVLGGAPLQVSGPAAGLTVLVLAFVNDPDLGYPLLGTAVLLAGVLQFAAGTLKLGQWFRAVSPAVIRGMLAGIGVLIFASQFHVMVDDKPRDSGWKNLLTIPEAIEKGAPLPEIGTQESRRFQTKQLIAVGILHEHQEEVHELVEEVVSREPHEEQAEQQAARLKELAPRQSEIHESLEEQLYAIESTENAFVNESRRERTANAMRLALAATERAEIDLVEGRIDTARESQKEAAAALANVLSKLKNHEWAAKIGLLAILIIVGWQSLKMKALKFLPPPLVAIVVVTFLTAVFKLPVLFVEVPDRLIDGVHLPSWTVLQDAPWGQVFKGAVVFAIVASAETLLCATAVDKMHTGTRTNYDRELAAQGVGNVCCGVLGALPMTGVIVRSAANVQAGGRTRWSAILHGLWLLLFVAALGFVLRLIPTAALAAILVYIGWKLMNFKGIKELMQYGWGEVVVFFATVIMIVATDLLTGVITGVVLAAAKLLFTFSHLKIDTEHDADQNRTVMHLHGVATFIRLPALAAALEEIPPGTELHVELHNLQYVDHACLELLMDWAKQHESTGGRLVIDWDTLHASFRRDAPDAAQNRKSA
ncbi:MAG: STAS domain-containing protein [Planctomycetota bacterium]|nr:MAG: STAS domain-containing protein [Planctomycetota bacterium]REJ95356.1 MAG: STAS domain-containing protein [Planctomycetota bacterium]REK24451.1 MAG: STAS domain-containing protein [Planctomycetota bacterium]REK38640.1 MAG: STAS domain-containing protein [Planctomycetota bacterium]